MVPPEVAANPVALRGLPPEQAAPIIDAYADAVDFVFLWVVPVALIGFVVAWFLKEVPLRDSARVGAGDMGEGFSVPNTSDRVALLERAVSSAMSKARREGPVMPRMLADAGSGLTRGEAWAVGQVFLHNKIRGTATIDAIAVAHRVPEEVVEPIFLKVIGGGLVDAEDGCLRLTAAGQAEVDRVEETWRSWLSTRLDTWDDRDPDDRALLDLALRNIATDLLEEQLREEDTAKVG
ncbi:hypothetical protein [Nocardia sp. NPDC005366]|uniref:hypothetical protein n=1 Tax=Nocardia sp. NPDC005366 TaxID=3156878 RepID=UPI0033A0611A